MEPYSKKRRLLFSSILLESAKGMLDANQVLNFPFLDEIRALCLMFAKAFKTLEEKKAITPLEASNIVFLFEDDQQRHQWLDIVGDHLIEKTLPNKLRKELYHDLFVSFENEMNRYIDENLEVIQDMFGENDRGYPQTFLSYAYDDKGITFALFFYFRSHGNYLYIDWMHSPAYPNGVAIKKSLGEALSNSNQLLFLYTPNSEITLNGGKRTLKQWCSWEFGGFYPAHSGKKFYLRVPSRYVSRYDVPDILDTFLEMQGIDGGGTIYGSTRSLFSFYMPNNEAEFVDIALNLLSAYVSPRYACFQREFSSSNRRIDAYDPKRKIGIEFKLLRDNFKGRVDPEFRFKNSYDLDLDILQREKPLYPQLERRLGMVLEQAASYDCQMEAVIGLPSKESTSLAKDEANLIGDLMMGTPKNNVRKLYLFFADCIYCYSIVKERMRFRRIAYAEADE